MLRHGPFFNHTFWQKEWKVLQLFPLVVLKQLLQNQKAYLFSKLTSYLQNLYRALMCAPRSKNQSMQGITSSQFTTQKLLCNMQNRKQQTLACLLFFRKTKKISTPISMK